MMKTARAMTFSDFKTYIREYLHRWWTSFYDFCFYGALGALVPFLSPYFRALGLSPWQIGVLGGLRPLIAFICGPIWSYLGNQYKARKVILMASLVSWFIFTMPIGFIEEGEEGICFHGQEQLQILSNQSTVHDGAGDEQNGTILNAASPDDQSDSLMIRYNPYARSIFTKIFVLVVIGEFLQSATDVLNVHLDGTVLEPLGVLYQQDGRNNIWAIFGMCVMAFLAGYLVSSLPEQKICSTIYGNYVLCFVIFGVLVIFALLLASRFEFHYRRYSRRRKVHFSPFLFCSRGHFGFIIIVILMGLFRGVLNTFLFWKLVDIGGIDILIGVLVIVQCVSDTLANITCPYVMPSMGYAGMIFGGLSCYGIRFLIYSYIETPSSTWVALAVESLHGIAEANVWSAFLLYITNYTPPETFPSGLFIVQGLYLGLGAGIGSIIGGVMVSSLGIPVGFKLLAAFAVFVCIIVVFTHSFDHQPIIPGEAPSLELYSDDEVFDEDSDIEMCEGKVYTRGTYQALDDEETTIYDAGAKYVMPSSGPAFVQIYMSFVQRHPSKS